MALVTLGVNKNSKFFLYNLPLSIQILAINFFITFIGFFFLILFNYFLIKNDESLEKKNIIANQKLIKIQNFLEKNSIIRVPLFDDNCTGENIDICKDNINFELSEPVLEPKITQEYILNNYLNSEFVVKIYNDDWIRLVDTLDFYDLSVVQEIDLKEEDLKNNNSNIFGNFSQNYIRFFTNYYDYLIRRELQNLTTSAKAEISYVKESIKDQIIKKYIIKDSEENIYQYLTSPIINNKKVYGVIILNYPITNQALDLGFISLNILIFFILFVLIMVFMSLIFSQSLVSPIKKLSKLTILERESMDKNNIIYPERKDEIGVLSKEIKKMSQGLKAQIIQLEKFSADVSHELKNPLTSLQSAMELIGKRSTSKENKKLLIINMQNDLKRMNQLITDISKFTRLKAEIELERKEYIILNNFLEEIPIIFSNNTNEVKLILENYEEKLEIIANKTKLIQVFINLIENSISLTSKKSKVLIKLNRLDKTKAIIKLYDQGKGIDLKDSEKIFERFYSDRQENVKNHSGLGLSIAREIITHMNGHLILDKSDKSEYSGACFLIILPIKQIV